MDAQWPDERQLELGPVVEDVELEKVLALSRQEHAREEMERERRLQEQIISSACRRRSSVPWRPQWLRRSSRLEADVSVCLGMA
jgi:hypothetical protein